MKDALWDKISMRAAFGAAATCVGAIGVGCVGAVFAPAVVPTAFLVATGAACAEAMIIVTDLYRTAMR